MAITFCAATTFAQTQVSQDSLDQQKMENYFSKHDLHPTRNLYDGVYFSIVKIGTGKELSDNDLVKIKYKRSVLNSKFKHGKSVSFKGAKTLSFKEGQGTALKGIESGVAHLPKGTKLILYVPSSMGFGATKHGTVAANSVLVYDIEILN